MKNLLVRFVPIVVLCFLLSSVALAAPKSVVSLNAGKATPLRFDGTMINAAGDVITLDAEDRQVLDLSWQYYPGNSDDNFHVFGFNSGYQRTTSDANNVYTGYPQYNSERTANFDLTYESIYFLPTLRLRMAEFAYIYISGGFDLFFMTMNYRAEYSTTEYPTDEPMVDNNMQSDKMTGIGFMWEAGIVVTLFDHVSLLVKTRHSFPYSSNLTFSSEHSYQNDEIDFDGSSYIVGLGIAF